MDPLELAPQLPVDAGWMMVALLLAYSGFKMTPALSERVRAQTKLLTARDAKHADEIVKKLNGRVYHDIERFLISSETFRERFATKHQLDAIEGEQRRMFVQMDEHAREDREVHDRVKALEVRMEQVKENVREIKDDLRAAAKTVTEEAKAVRREQSESERRILEHLDELFERRREARS